LSIEVYKALDDGNNNGEIIKGDGKSVPHGEGYLYIGNCTTDSNGNFDCQIQTDQIAVGDFITAIAIDPDGNTSEFSANYKVSGIYTISGYVFEDSNHDTIRERGEKAISDIRVELWEQNGTTWEMINATTTDNNGYFSFTPPQEGTYRIIEDYNNNAGDNPDKGSDPVGYISTTPNVVEINWDYYRNVIVNFGDFKGSRIEGYVFDDSGSTSPNDALKDSDEWGIPSVKILLCSDFSCSSPVAQTFTSSNGSYSLWIPSTSVPNGSKVFVREIDPNGYLSTGCSENSTVIHNATAPTIYRNTLNYTMQSGQIENNWDFGDVRALEIYRDHSAVITPGATATVEHKVVIHTPGKIAIRLDKPGDVSVALYADLNCTGEIKGTPMEEENGYYFLSGNDLGKGTYCFEMKVSIPSNSAVGSDYEISVWANEDWKDTEGINGDTGTAFDDMNFNDDTFRVSASYSGGMLRLKKEVRDVSDNGTFGESNEAKPGDVLEYRISFKNISAEEVKEIVIGDELPRYTELERGEYGGKDVELEIGNETYEGTADEGDADGDGVGLFGRTLKVDVGKLTGGKYEELPSGMGGFILYRVRIDNSTN
jgi:uncharacterized repeat protein (TIGR01451 family)